MSPRVAIVGVRRVRQGLGEHFARWLAAAGAEVPAFVGRTEESVEEGRAVLASHGVAARGFTSLPALLRAEPVEALVIASPAQTHAAWLEQALAANLHVLCEKPLVWGVPDPARLAASLVARFTERGLLLREHCQWPETLPGYFRLHPGVEDEELRTFEMELAPTTTGEDLLVDAMSHPLSLLQELLGPHRMGPRIRGLSFSTRDRSAEDLTVAFDLEDAVLRGPVRVSVRLRRVPAPPRPAAYSVNGRRAERRIRLPEYAFSLADGEREVPLEDPMRLLVARFVGDLRTGRRDDPDDPDDDAIVERMRLLAEIVAAFRAGG